MLVSGSIQDVTPSVVGARRRALGAFAAFASGLLLSQAWPSPVLSWQWLLAALFVCLLSFLLRRPFALPCLAVAAILFGLGWHTLRTREAPSDALDRFATDASVITVEGIILDPLERTEPPRLGLSRFVHTPQSLRTRLKVRAALTPDDRSISTSGILWLRIDDVDHDLPFAGPGDHVRVTGTFSAVNPPHNPGERDLRPLARQWGVAGSLRLSSHDLIIPLDHAAPPDWVGMLAPAERWFLITRAAMRDRAARALSAATGTAPGNPGNDAAHLLLAGLLLGEYDESGTQLRNAFSRVGLAHILSISGFHLAVMAGVMLFLVRLTGDRGALEPLIVAAMVLLYLMIVPAGSPLARSAAMVLLLLIGEALGRRYDRVTLLIWIAIALLIWRPLDLWNLGFQLSVGLTGLLLWQGSAFHARLFGASLRGTVRERTTISSRFVRSITHAATLAISCAMLCWIVSTPLIVQTIGILSPIAIFATILLTPFIIIAMWIGYVALLIGMLWPDAAALFAPLLSAIASTVVASVEWGDSIRGGSVRLWPIGPMWAIGATIVALAWVCPAPAREGARGRTHRHWSRGFATVLVLLWAMQQWWGSSQLPRDVLLRIDTLSVGSGTCHIIRSGGDAILWDAGPMGTSGVLPPLLAAARAINVWRVPTLIVTHPDTDHFAGADVAMETLGVRELITTQRTLTQAASNPRGSAAALLDAMQAGGVTVRAAASGEMLTFGNASVAFLSPPPSAPWLDAAANDNDHSLVALFEVSTSAGPRRLLMTGDIGPAAINALRDHPALASANQAHIDILELPHHGSFNEASLALALDLAPSAIIQSTGPERARDPRWAAARAASTWHSTAESGATWIQIHHDGTITSGK